MRKVHKHIIHCSATPLGRDVSADEIRRWHTDPKSKGGRGWSDIGYHMVIDIRGDMQGGRPLSRNGAHVRGHNTGSIGTCLVGPGGGIANFSDRQLKTLFTLHESFKVQFPGITLHGHREFSSKDCPGFDISELMEKWKEMGLC